MFFEYICILTKKIKNMKTKKVLVIAIALLCLTVTSCKKEKGCTTSSATNFSSSAEEDDASCTYLGRVAFWITTGSMDPDVSINVYINNVFQGNIAVEFSSAPTCGSTGVLTINKDLGKNKTQSYSVTYKPFVGGVEITDPTEWIIENVIFEATGTSHQIF